MSSFSAHMCCTFNNSNKKSLNGGEIIKVATNVHANTPQFYTIAYRIRYCHRVPAHFSNQNAMTIQLF